MAKKSRSRQFKHSSQVIDIQEARAKRQARREKQRQETGAGRKVVGKAAIRKRARQNKIRRTLIYFGVITVLTIMITTSIFRIFSLKQQQQELIQDNEDLQARQKLMLAELKYMSDPEYIEEQARAQLRLVMPGDKVCVFPSENKDGP